MLGTNSSLAGGTTAGGRPEPRSMREAKFPMKVSLARRAGLDEYFSSGELWFAWRYPTLTPEQDSMTYPD